VSRAVSSYRVIYDVVRRIPPGQVATYGQIARLAGLPGRARQVGYAMAALPLRSTVPWHRVVNSQGSISLRRRVGPELEQRLLLEAEGVPFGMGGRIPLERVQWTPKELAPRRHR